MGPSKGRARRIPVYFDPFMADPEPIVGLTAERHAGGAEEWDYFARVHSGFTDFLRWGWKLLIEEVLEHQCRYLTARGNDGQLAGVLPLVGVKSTLFGQYLVSMPFLNYGGPLGIAQGVPLLAGEAVREAERSGAGLNP